MQTVETTRALGEVDRELIIDTLKTLSQRRIAGDIDGVMKLFSADVVLFPESSWGFANYARKVTGTDAVRESLRQRHINYVITKDVIHRILIDGDQAAVHRSVAVRERGGGGTCEFDCIDFLRFRDGLIVEFQACPDGMARKVVVNYPH